MARHIITEEIIKQFILLLKLNKKQRDLLITELKNAKPALSPKQLAKQIDKKVGLSLTDLGKCISGLFHIYACRRQNDHPIEECAEVIFEKMKISLDKKEKIDADFKEFLHELLKIDQSIGISEKAIDLAMANEKLTIGLKIYTDVRPAFSSLIENNNIAALILHKLELTYLENGNKIKTYFTMDSDDLFKLKATIERAESKEKMLRENSNLKSIHFFEFPKE